MLSSTWITPKAPMFKLKMRLKYLVIHESVPVSGEIRAVVSADKIGYPSAMLWAPCDGRLILILLMAISPQMTNIVK